MKQTRTKKKQFALLEPFRLIDENVTVVVVPEMIIRSLTSSTYQWVLLASYSSTFMVLINIPKTRLSFTILLFVFFWIFISLKCIEFLFAFSGSACASNPSFFTTNPLSRVDSTNYLRIIIDRNLRWPFHIPNCVQELRRLAFRIKDSGISELNK